MEKKLKIGFDEDLAAEIVAKFSLNPRVIKVWRTRGHIPGAYVTGVIDNSEKLSDNDPQYQKFLEILAMPEIASSKFRTLGKKGSQVVLGKDRMTEAERIGFFTEIVELRNKLRKAMDIPNPTNFTAVLKDVRVHPTNLISPSLISRIKRDMLDADDKKVLKSTFMRLFSYLKV